MGFPYKVILTYIFYFVNYLFNYNMERIVLTFILSQCYNRLKRKVVGVGENYTL